MSDLKPLVKRLGFKSVTECAAACGFSVQYLNRIYRVKPELFKKKVTEATITKLNNELEKYSKTGR